MARIRADRPFEAWFDAVVVSCEVGIVKPNPMIYQTCLSRLGGQPNDALFVDDRPENIEAAARLGIRTFHSTGEEVQRQFRDCDRTGAIVPHVGRMRSNALAVPRYLTRPPADPAEAVRGPAGTRTLPRLRPAAQGIQVAWGGIRGGILMSGVLRRARGTC
jgi:hypothetical protein